VNYREPASGLLRAADPVTGPIAHHALLLLLPVYFTDSIRSALSASWAVNPADAPVVNPVIIGPSLSNSVVAKLILLRTISATPSAARSAGEGASPGGNAPAGGMAAARRCSATAAAAAVSLSVLMFIDSATCQA
jgi:hypothetical protein